MTVSINADAQRSISYQTINGVDFTIENRTDAVVKVILIEKSVAESLAEIKKKPYRDLYSLLVNDAYLIEAAQVYSPEDPELAYFFTSTTHFVVSEKDSLLTLQGTKSNGKVKNLFLRKHPDLDGFVVTHNPPVAMSVEKILGMAHDVLKHHPETDSFKIAYNDYGALLHGAAFYWASSIDTDMQLISDVDMCRNRTFKISNDDLGIGITRKITGHRNGNDIQSIFINHFPTQSLEITQDP